MGLTNAVDLDFIGDTGARGCLGSPEAFKKQGFDRPCSYLVDTSSPLRFATGGGPQSGSTTIGCWTEEFESISNIYMLPQCPLALCIGQLCNDGF